MVEEEEDGPDLFLDDMSNPSSGSCDNEYHQFMAAYQHAPFFDMYTDADILLIK